jgi:cell wall-associated NlpC family hydrolase
VPVRREPADFQEQVNQILFGEQFEILESNAQWVLVKTDHDGYQGWISRKQFKSLSEEEYEFLSSQSKGIVRPALTPITSSLGVSFYIPMGSIIPQAQNHHFDLGAESYYIKEEILENPIFNQEILNESIQSFLNSPYQWGGRSILGVDCSGFTQILYRLMGIFLPRDASQQVQVGLSVSFMEEGQFGDLAFFGEEEGRITHVGILMGSNRIAHASGKVRIDWVDHQGIFNRDLGLYTHQLRAIRRISQ